MSADLACVDLFSDLLSVASTASDLCKRLTHSGITGSCTIGVHLYSVDQQARLGLVGTYGQGLKFEQLSIWDENLLGIAVRELKPMMGLHKSNLGEEYQLACLPLEQRGNPVGVLVSVSKEPCANPLMELTDLPAKVTSRLTAFWMETLGVRRGQEERQSRGFETSDPSDLTHRQLEVLQGIADQKTNAQIATELILSESTIRQETVRIYRALSVSGRAEAAKRALHLGIITRAAI